METRSKEQTQKIGEDLAKTLKAGDIVCMFGDLGAGKTVLAQGIAKGLGIKRRILSPTFVFMRTYPLKSHGKNLTLFHLDLYRVEKAADLKSFNLEEVFESDGIFLLEWANKVKNALPKKRIDIEIKVLSETKRKITITHPEYSSNEVRSYLKNYDKKAIRILKSGGVVIFPTDTVYGVGARLGDETSMNRIRKIKGTPQPQRFPVLVSGTDQVEQIADINKTARRLVKKHWPGGLTIIMNARHPDSEIVTPPRSPSYSNPGLEQVGEQGKMGFRMPDSMFLLNVISEVGPIIGTSANFHGRPTPKSYEDLDPDFIKLADYVIVGKCKGGVESTVIDTTVSPPKLLRQGAVALTEHLRGGL